MTGQRRALVTGAGEGIGRALARRLAASGYTITAVARSQDRLDGLVGELGPGHRVLAADLATGAGCDRVLQELQGAHYDLLVNNAGAATAGPFAEVPLEQATSMIRLNCRALVTLAHAFLSGARAGDALINVAPRSEAREFADSWMWSCSNPRVDGGFGGILRASSPLRQPVSPYPYPS